MWFYISMFLCNLLIPLVMLIAGHYMQKCPPKKINGYIGYRSSMAKKNKDTWLFAHMYCGTLWKTLGAVLLIPSILVQLPIIHASDDVIGIMTAIPESVQVVVMLVSIAIVEKALRKTFDSNGIKK